ncbi:uncharacterized protein LOC111876818 [Lactuca sativa]|uniref:uncharacterized protein LOC111876818 n=1 Tax=Lactuca sativa TaxID=4236 RepID=UPI0022AFF74A|nr:uncharacterized protein LOC111876818 [Lactuca sativa]
MLYDEYKKANEEKYKMKTRGFYQKEESVKDKKMDFEDMLTRFAAASEKRHNETDVAIREQQAMMKEQQSLMRNQQASIMTTRSGKIINLLTPIMNDDTREVQEKQKEDPNSQSSDPTRRVGNMDSTSPPSEKKNDPPLKPYQSPLPFPSWERQEKQNEDYQNFLEHIKSLQINIPFIEAVAQMPKYAKFLKEQLTSRKKLEEVFKVVLNENCPAAMLNKLPKKMGDPTLCCVVKFAKKKKRKKGCKMSLLTF